MDALINIFEIKPRKNLIKALITSLEPVHNVFHFSDIEITPTLEEMARYIEFGRDLRKQQLKIFEGSVAAQVLGPPDVSK